MFFCLFFLFSCACDKKMQISSEFLAMPGFHTNVLIHVNFMMFVSSGWWSLWC